MFSVMKNGLFDKKLWLLSLSYLPLAFSQITNATFDFIVVGGGTSGLLIAERLSDDPSISVAVLEAGQAVADNLTLIPEIFGNFVGSDIDWKFVSVPQKHASNLELALPRGKLLGGTSSVNGMYFVRAHQKEYDLWEQLGNPGWNWDVVDAHIKAVETFHPAPISDQEEFAAIDLPSDHGSSGPIQVSYSIFWEPRKFIADYIVTLNALGINRTTRASGGSPAGVWQTPTAIKADNRSRSAVGTDFVLAGNKKKNLRVFTGAEVTKIDLENTTSASGIRATGVEFLLDGKPQTVKLSSRGNVIVSAGTYQTPKLLELSGIGNSAILSAKGIKTAVNLTGVGENLQDHEGVYISYEVISANQTAQDLGRNATYRAEQEALYNKSRTGALSSVPGTSVVFLPIQSIVTPERLTELTSLLDKSLESFKGTPLEKQLQGQRDLFLDADVPDIELTLSPGLVDPKLTPDPTKHHQTIAAIILRPFSRGTAHLNTTNPLDLPLIDPNFLAFSDFDIGILTDSIKFVEKLTQTKPLSDLVISQLGPAPNSTDAEYATYIQEGVFSVWHPAGSASMLPKEQDGVVDASLKVYGTKNIRVADASIIPVSLGTHTLASVYANALKAVEIFKAEL